ncbi:sugar-binding transcriptional regulator [Bacillus sp. WMMC1349]|uniref:sugar-binding transcriptional regulator n=1 Tax=Bacillus sp. WMMC1349 TaxID=2736254 RepID=UPI001557650D|nr:sugar-binding transcriptional regulator [Bacillus sp. WMMC1349]NPC94217.1 sugar-binding transcriptional regulator [Bacillus sp. WMMC1349]
MNQLIQAQKKLLPDLLDVMQKRYEILQYIRLTEPIGRRSLAASLGISERILRAEVQFLKQQNLLEIKTTGMTLTTEGSDLLKILEETMKDVLGLTVLENTLRKRLNLEQVIIVSGDSDHSPLVKKEMGRAAVACMKKRFQGENIVAVTGGTTLEAVADMMTPDSKNRKFLFVPARGGLGENVRNQANTICAHMAEKASGTYKLLFVPGELSKEAYSSIIVEPSIKELLEIIQSSSMVIHGIGDATTMAKRRNTPEEGLKKIEEKEAVAEAFGYYFDSNGEVVHKVHSVGIQLEDLDSIPNIIAVAGGSSKAEAIEAYFKKPRNTVLVTDEGAAKQLLREDSSLNIK